jgi:hypothetical protein
MSVRVVDRQGTPADEVRFLVGGRQRSRRVETPEDAHAFDAGIRAWLWPQWFAGGDPPEGMAVACLIVTLVGLIAFGGFAKGKWY